MPASAAFGRALLELALALWSFRWGKGVQLLNRSRHGSGFGKLGFDSWRSECIVIYSRPTVMAGL